MAVPLEGGANKRPVRHQQATNKQRKTDVGFSQAGATTSCPERSQTIRAPVAAKAKRQRTGMNPSHCFSPLGLPEIIGDSTSIYIGKHKLRIGLLDPPRVVVRDVVSFVCDLTDQESAALDAGSMTRTIQCVAYNYAS